MSKNRDDDDDDDDDDDGGVNDSWRIPWVEVSGFRHSCSQKLEN